MNRYPLLTSDTVVEHAVLADGDFPTHPVALRLLRQARHLVCCDHAGEAALAHGLDPEAIVGDGDSILPEQLRRFGSRYHRIVEQDDNDLTKATRYLLAHSKDADRPTVFFFGATGKREDHTLGNISLMEYYRSTLGICPVMVTNYGWFVAGCGPAVFNTFQRQQVSLFNLSCRRHFAATGLKWQPFLFTQWWQGTLNEALGQTVEVDADGDWLIFRTFEPK
jgi:thiamine pyrophosphokinase